MSLQSLLYIFFTVNVQLIYWYRIGHLIFHFLLSIFFFFSFSSNLKLCTCSYYLFFFLAVIHYFVVSSKMGDDIVNELGVKTTRKVIKAIYKYFAAICDKWGRGLQHVIWVSAFLFSFLLSHANRIYEWTLFYVCTRKKEHSFFS